MDEEEASTNCGSVGGCDISGGDSRTEAISTVVVTDAPGKGKVTSDDAEGCGKVS